MTILWETNGTETRGAYVATGRAAKLEIWVRSTLAGVEMDGQSQPTRIPTPAEVSDAPTALTAPANELPYTDTCARTRRN